MTHEGAGGERLRRIVNRLSPCRRPPPGAIGCLVVEPARLVAEPGGSDAVAAGFGNRIGAPNVIVVWHLCALFERSPQSLRRWSCSAPAVRRLSTAVSMMLEASVRTVLVRDVIAPQWRRHSTFDYNPSESPADLAASTDVVFRSGSIISIEIGDEYSTVLVDDVEMIADSRPDQTPITQFGAFGAGIEDRPSIAVSALQGLEVVVFAHMSDGAPGNPVAAIEGFWLQCGDEAPLSVVANPTGEAWNHALASLDGIAAATAGELPVGDVAIRVDQGDGWRLVDTAPGFGHPHEVAIMTSERGLDRAADARWFETRPAATFDDQVVVVLAPAVSGSCPGIIFEGLTITENRVFGNFEPGPPPENTDVCTDDANPVAFVFVIERGSLPDTFALSVAEDVICGGCEHAQIDVDLSVDAALELALWGGGTLDIVIDGTPPVDGSANVFRWAPEAALMLPTGAFIELPRWIQSFETSEALTIEGFVVDCGAGGCPEECDDQACQNLEPLGNICSYNHEPEAFVDRTVTITWNGIDCEISATTGRADR